MPPIRRRRAVRRRAPAALRRGSSAAGRAAALTAALVAAPVIGAACGGAGPASNGEAAKPAAAVLRDAKAAMGGLRSFHVAGSEANGGQRVTVDLDLGTSSGGGTISLGGATLQVVQVASTVYLRGDTATWTTLAGSAQAGALFGGRWLKTTTANPSFQGLTNLTNVPSFLSQLAPGGDLKKGSTTTFSGHRAVPLTDATGADGTVYVAATGRPYLLGANGAGSKSATGSLTFDQFGTAKVPAAPTGAVDFDQLEQGTGAKPGG